ncbi:MAG: undecaprenyl-diphosphate phosphatase [Candidatus Omnitrophica bacterium]|nr:undecaprenyl-diphosphate phosphatase [Candidatus Omnitrophota bacterium]MCM8800055.1 undecaprenyl-diphosphate phosphatase [Candidatus Omnitrophota bacterium]
MDYIILGIVQGITEFLPISSSAHLVIIEKIYSIQMDNLSFILFCHLGSIFALFFYLFKDILRLFKSPLLLGYIFIATFITGFFGILFKDYFETTFCSLKIIASALLINGIILFLTRYFLEGRREIFSLKLNDVILFGLAQTLSIIPGISRSGVTISCLLFRKFDREVAFRFSFLAGIPAILGAFILEFKKMDISANLELKKLILSLIVSFIISLFSISILKNFIKKAKFYYFGYYCIIIGIALFFIK